jgi:DNA-binding transcriptional regulator GbsR (MarR family)
MAILEGLGETHQRIYAWLAEQYEPVTTRQVKEALHFSSTAWVSRNLRELKTHGMVAQLAGSRRGETFLWVALDP